MTRMRRIITIVVIVALLVLGVCAQVLLSRRRPGDSPVVDESLIAALGGFRSLAAEVIWFRADQLQDQGRFGELVQLASMLTYLEPHDAEVWNYASWNLSYNIAARMPNPEDKWRWVYAGVRLLRDEGLKWNPREPRLYFELADRFELKIGTNHFDDDALVYQAEWRRLVEEARRTGDWRKLGMDPAMMAEVEERYRDMDIEQDPMRYTEDERRYRSGGPLDWGNAQASAMYWAHAGLPYATGRMRLMLAQKLMLARRLYGAPNKPPAEASE